MALKIIDGFATGYFPLKEQAGKPIFRGNLSCRAMRECATVDEVIALYKNCNLKSQRMEYYRLMFADAQGNLDDQEVHRIRFG